MAGLFNTWKSGDLERNASDQDDCVRDMAVVCLNEEGN